MSDIAKVFITRVGQIVTRAGFGLPMILGDHKRFTQRIKTYASLNAVAVDFEETDQEYLAAEAAFAQSPALPNLAIGRRQIDDTTVAVESAVLSYVYSCKIGNGVTVYHFSYTAIADDTIEDIAAGLVAAINLGLAPVTATDNEDGTFVIASDPAGTPYTFLIDSLHLSSVMGDPSETEAQALDAIDAVNSDWYAFNITSRLEADILSASVWVESKTKLFVTASDDLDILDPNATTDIAYQLQQLKRQRTGVLYYSLAATTFPDAAWLGAVLPSDVGQTIFAFKELIGFVADNLSADQKQAAYDKNANVYVQEYGQDITLQGTAASNLPMTYLDDIRCIDWLKVQLETDLAALIIGVNRNRKIPYTDAGITAIESVIKARLKNAVDINVLAPDPAPVVNVPRLADIPLNDRNIRKVSGITFNAVLAGAIQAVELQGYVV